MFRGSQTNGFHKYFMYKVCILKWYIVLPQPIAFSASEKYQETRYGGNYTVVRHGKEGVSAHKQRVSLEKGMCMYIIKLLYASIGFVRKSVMT